MAKDKTVIGRLSVKVWPSYDGFYKDVKDTMRTMEKGLPELEVGIKLKDASKKAFEKEVDHLVRDRTIHVDIKVDDTSIRKVRDKIDRTFDPDDII